MSEQTKIQFSSPGSSLKEEAKRIAIFGSTGSIGTQALDVISGNPANSVLKS